MNIKESIESVRKSFRTDSDPLPKDSKDLELLHIKYLGRKGLVADLFNNLKDVFRELNIQLEKKSLNESIKNMPRSDAFMRLT